jgi:hypothetical protein
MVLRRTLLLTFLLAMACSANAHEYVCTVENTRPVAIASFRLTKEDLLREQAKHGNEPCPLPDYKVLPLIGQTAAAGQSSPVKPNSPSLLKQGESGGNGTPPPPPMCGVVDKPHAQFHVASGAVYRYCTKQAQTASMSAATARIRTYRGIGFKVTRPAVYNAKKHHTAYTYDAGDVVGTCYVCIAREILAPPAEDIKADARQKD